MQLTDIQKLVTSDMQKVHNLIMHQLPSDVALIEQINNYILQNLGKRMRPLVILLIAKAFTYSGTKHINCASLIELIHTASLLHDDVVDESDMRRGKDTANKKFGNPASVLVGDFLYTKAFQMIAELNSIEILTLIAKMTNTIATGEVLQLTNKYNLTINESDYLKIIERKTAVLFAASAQIIAMVLNLDKSQQQELYNFGLHFGIAFQLIDDSLDYIANSEVLGKNLGDDLAEGQITLPLIYTIQQCNPAEHIKITTIIQQNQPRNSLAYILQMINKYSALDYVQNKAREHLKLALLNLNFLPKNQYTDGLINLTNLAINRDK